jgi:hypothetical protein
VDAAVAVEGLTKRFGATQALDGVDLAVAEGTVLGLLNPSVRVEHPGTYEAAVGSDSGPRRGPASSRAQASQQPSSYRSHGPDEGLPLPGLGPR